MKNKKYLLNNKTLKNFYDKIELKDCPCCKNKAHFEDLNMKNKGHVGIIYGRIVCNSNIPSLENRCWIKTVCGPIDKVIDSWNRRKI